MNSNPTDPTPKPKSSSFHSWIDVPAEVLAGPANTAQHCCAENLAKAFKRRDAGIYSPAASFGRLSAYNDTTVWLQQESAPASPALDGAAGNGNGASAGAIAMQAKAVTIIVNMPRAEFERDWILD